ncbi:MAG TPA: beta-galactosidase [Kiritimatiellia bacterium]|nr:beta-galactosidase [Kiritimatiellia bacterium]HPS07203.1 beta-galactosidase [Kiritimatiellia bacterium]
MHTRGCLFVCFVFGLSLASSGAGTENEPLAVRVRNTSGGPQIHVNGKPVPPRFFWGSENSGRLAAGTEWNAQSFEFTPDTDAAGNGTLHFRFSDTPCEVWISELRITEAKSGADILPAGSFASQEAFRKTWSAWPLGADNTVGSIAFDGGALRVSLKLPAAGAKRPDFHLHSRCGLAFAKGQTYRCTFRVKASVQTHLVPAVYRVDGGVHTRIGGPLGSFYNQVALARDAGVNLVSFAAPTCWAPPEQTQDWTPVDALCRRIIAVNPKVLLVPRFSANAPGWWLERHPEAKMVYDGNTPYQVACVSDRAYRTDMCAHLEKLARHLCEAFPDHFAGLHPCGQNTGEWFYYDSWKHPLSGYDPATRSAFREWLKARGDPDAATAEPPTAEARRAHPNGFLRNPAQEQRLIEFALFQQQEMSDFVAALASACRRGTGGKKLVVFFYGYGFEFPPLGNGAPTSGHYALGSLLKSTDIDILCSPISYTDREWRGTAPVMSAAESVMRSGILWLNEDDSRTFLDPRKQEHVQEGGLVNLEQTQQVMLRNTAQAALRGFGTWWMDLPGQGWFNDAAIWREIVRLRPVDEAMAQRTHPFTPEIAAIIDEASMCHLTGGSALAARPLIYEGRAALGRCGAPYGQYLLEDALARNVPARLQIFLSAWRLTATQRQALAAQREAGFWRMVAGWFGADASDVTRVWCWAPGYLRPDRCDIAGIQEVTGFKARAVAVPTAEATPTGLGRSRGLTQAWGPAVKIAPLFTVEASADEVWATYSDGAPAIAVRRTRTGHNVFVGVPELTPELAHALAKLAGVHCYTRPGPALWAANGYLSVQAHTNAPVSFDTGCDARVIDALDGTPIGKGPRVELNMKQGEVRVLRFGTR